LSAFTRRLINHCSTRLRVRITERENGAVVSDVRYVWDGERRGARQFHAETLFRRVRESRLKMENDFINKPSDAWDSLVDAHSNYVLRLQSFLSQGVDRVEILRESLRGRGRATALEVSEYLSLSEKMALFENWVFLASFSNGFIDYVRKTILSFPKDWVLSRIEAEAEKYLAEGTYDEYRRFLELYYDLDLNLTRKLALRAVESDDADIKEAGEDALEWLRSDEEKANDALQKE
jgi:hypothetical protein